MAVIKDFPEKSTLSGDLICSTNLKIRHAGSCNNNKCTDFYNSLVLLKPNASALVVSSKPETKAREIYDALGYKYQPWIRKSLPVRQTGVLPEKQPQKTVDTGYMEITS